MCGSGTFFRNFAIQLGPDGDDLLIDTLQSLIFPAVYEQKKITALVDLNAERSTAIQLMNIKATANRATKNAPSNDGSINLTDLLG